MRLINRWSLLIVTPFPLIALAAFHRFPFLPEREDSRHLLEIILQAHAAFAALSLVIVVVLLEGLQRSEYADLVWQDFQERTGLKVLTIGLFGAITLEAIALGVMQAKPEDSPLPALPGTANLLLIGYAGIVFTFVSSSYLLMKVFEVMRSSYFGELATTAAQREVRQRVTDEVRTRLARIIFANWATQLGIRSELRRRPSGWVEVKATTTGHVSDICLSRLADLHHLNALDISVRPGQRVTEGRDVLGYIQNGTAKQGRMLLKSFRIGMGF